MHVFLEKKHIWGGPTRLGYRSPAISVGGVAFDPILLAVLVSFGALVHKIAELSIGEHHKHHSMLHKLEKVNEVKCRCGIISVLEENHFSCAAVFGR